MTIVGKPVFVQYPTPRRQSLFSVIDRSIRAVASEAKSIEDNKQFAASNANMLYPPTPFSKLIEIQGKFGFVRDIIEKKVDHALTPLVLKSQSDKPDAKQEEKARRFLKTGGRIRDDKGRVKNISLRDLFKCALMDRVGLGPGAVEVARQIERGEPAKLKHIPAHTCRQLCSGLWAQPQKIQRPDLSAFDDRTVYFQPYGDKVVRDENGKLVRWNMIDSLTAKPTDSFPNAANEIKVFHTYSALSPYYGLPDFYGATENLEIIEKNLNQLNDRLGRPMPNQIILVDSDGATDPDTGEDLRVRELSDLFSSMMKTGKAGALIVPIVRNELNVPGIEIKEVNSGLNIEQSERSLFNNLKLVLMTMGTPASVANIAFQGIGGLTADTGQWQIKSWRESELSPLRDDVIEFINELFEEMGITDWRAEFTPMEEVSTVNTLNQAQTDEIDIRSGVKDVDECRDGRGLMKRSQPASSLEKSGPSQQSTSDETAASSAPGGSEESAPVTQPSESADQSTERSPRPSCRNEQRTPTTESQSGLSAEQWQELADEKRQDQAELAAALLASVLLLPGIEFDLSTADAVIAEVADKIVAAGADNIPAILKKYRPRLEKAFGTKLSDVELAEVAGAAKEHWALVVRERWLGTHQSIASLVDRVGSDDAEQLAAEAENWEGNSFKKRLVLAEGAALALQELQLSTLQTTESIAREATDRPVDRLHKVATEKAGEAQPEELVEWRTHSLQPCEDCIDLEAGNPYKPSELTNRPGDGQTRCRHNCYCVIVPIGTEVKGQTEVEAEAHLAELRDAANERARTARAMVELFNEHPEKYGSALRKYADGLLAEFKAKAEGKA